jgi:acetylornithine deacetylase/succinyl-diaminopimelate desuccinylase-like protein
MTAEAYLESRSEQVLDQLKEFLRIPSISSLLEHAGDVQHAAQWAAERLQDAGLEHVTIMPTGGHPVVYGDWLHATGMPTVLIYGHVDVQPVDPVDLWISPPFEPTVRDGRIYARGASDMKANVLMSILGVEAVLANAGSLPVNVKFILEAEEEIGSPNLPAFVATHRDLLACDLAISGDGPQFSEDQPSLLLGLRGGCGLQLNVYGATSDLHSGFYGGAVPNPLHALVDILHSMHALDGTIMVDGFFDDVVPLSDADRKDIAAIPFHEEKYFDNLGLQEGVGEAGYSTLERIWARPTLEINGIWGGFQGEGIKTVLPKEAHAKITCRLVPKQGPERILRALTQHIERNVPHGVRVEIIPLPFRAEPYLIPMDHWGNRAVAEVLEGLYSRRPYYVRMGASVPVCETFLSTLGAYTVTLGFTHEDENLHAPNEFFRLSSFERGSRAWVRVLQRLGTEDSTQILEHRPTTTRLQQAVEVIDPGGGVL